jgi:DnaJ-class molecular chaperone
MNGDHGRVVKCARCNGTGMSTMGISKVTCPACNGSGYQRIQ